MISGIIYKIYNLNDTSQFYIGSTVNFSRRKSHHKKNVTNKRGKRYWTKLYLYIRDNGGWINFGMEQLIKQDFNSLNDLHIFEQNLINNLKPTLNSIRASIIQHTKTDDIDDIEDHWVMTSYKPSDSIEEHPEGHPKGNPEGHPDKSPLLFIIDLE
jgi:hypothetical protein